MEIKKKGSIESLIQGTIRVNKFYLEHTIKDIWEKCPNCGSSSNFILIQTTDYKKAKFQIGWYDYLQCSDCGYKEDITDFDTW